MPRVMGVELLRQELLHRRPSDFGAPGKHTDSDVSWRASGRFATAKARNAAPSRFSGFEGRPDVVPAVRRYRRRQHPEQFASWKQSAGTAAITIRFQTIWSNFSHRSLASIACGGVQLHHLDRATWCERSRCRRSGREPPQPKGRLELA